MFKVTRPYALLSGIVVYCCHGDGSDGRHVYHGHTHYYQGTMLVISLASHTLTHKRGSGQAAIVELCNLDGFDDVTSSGAMRCDQVIAIS